ncbi:MAG: lipid A deacylase LpxR family protein [Pseudomonadaceae bacterium]|nr:lipid A deacylase LpxR family protein [Pseudomonadaceae bacterium]
METTRSLVLATWLILLSCNSLANTTVSFDNDILTGSDNDRDYTGGIRATFERSRSKTWQGGLLFYTPDDLSRSDVDTSDRPYANLLFIARSKAHVSERAITRQTISSGIIGSRLGSSVYRAIHDVTGSQEPNGSDKQLSDGGEPTFRLGWTRYTLLTDTSTQFANISLIAETAASVGYATDVSVGIALQLSKKPRWWGEGRDEFLPHLDEPQRRGQNGVFGGFRIRAVGYNALLQGQFRESAHTIDAGRLKRLVGEVWLGLATSLRGLNFRYSIRAQSAEFEGGRHQVWGSLTISWTPRAN